MQMTSVRPEKSTQGIPMAAGKLRTERTSFTLEFQYSTWSRAQEVAPTVEERRRTTRISSTLEFPYSTYLSYAAVDVRNGT
jgi:hypothetical protein